MAMVRIRLGKSNIPAAGTCHFDNSRGRHGRDCQGGGEPGIVQALSPEAVKGIAELVRSLLLEWVNLGDLWKGAADGNLQMGQQH